MGRREEGNMQQKVRMEPEDKPKERYDVMQQTGCPLDIQLLGHGSIFHTESPAIGQVSSLNQLKLWSGR
jgi:hypothetical protein